MLEVVEQVRVDVPDIEFCCPPSVSVRSSGKAGLGRVGTGVNKVSDEKSRDIHLFIKVGLLKLNTSLIHT